MTFDSILTNNAPAPVKTPVKTPTEKPKTRPRTPYNPKPGTNPRPKAIAED